MVPVNSTAVVKTGPMADMKQTLKAFFAGSKVLFGQLKTYRKLRKVPLEELSWREAKIVAETPRHFLRMLPLVLNPLPVS